MKIDLIMKRGILFVILGVLVLTFLIAQVGFVKHGRSISEEDELSKVSSAVLEKVEEGEGVRVYIKLKSKVRKGKSIASKSIKEEVSDILGKKIRHTFDDKISAFVSEEELLELQNNSNIESIELVGMRSISLQDSVPLINSSTELWNLQVNSINLTGEHETICIIDTGVNYSHVDLGGCFGNNNPDSSCKVLGGYDYCADDATCTTSDSDPMDAHWHGTHVSGIAAANGVIDGVAPDAKLIVIKASNSTGTFWDDDLEKAIDWCVNNASTFNISVISMSLGGGLYSSYCNNDPLNNSINNAVANNISVVVASGNNAKTSQISGPACHENATPIGGTDKSDAMYVNGNRNSLVLLLAPGVTINSTYINGGYAGSSGTSMSTPHVAGAIAIITQYRRLEGLSEMTPSEIEDALNDSGKIISDGGSGLDFSRIKIYSTILDMDESGPDITLDSPTDNAISSSENQTFTCTATDIQLNNLTFYLWNSSNDLINETSFNATGNNFEIEVNQTLDNGTYTWNCLGYDDKSNSALASSNYTLKIGGMLVTLNSPSDDSYTTTNSITFNCTSQGTVASLTNATLYIWDSSDALTYNTTESISGTSNTTTFDYNLSSEESYDWNCMAYDEDSNSISGSSNHTLIYDNTDPVVSLEDPDDEATETEGSIDFEYSVTDTNDIVNCSLIIDDDINDTDTTISKSTTQEIDATLGEGVYDWKIRCFDGAGNRDDSEERELTVEAESSSSDDDDDDDSTTTTTTTTTTGITYTLTDTDFEKGVPKNMKKKDKIKFNKNNEAHTLEVEDVTASVIRVKISSNPITLIIAVGTTKKADLNTDNIYDIAVTYNKYKNSTADITIKSINESIGTRQISTPSPTSNETTTIGTESIIKSIGDFFKNLGKTWIIIAIIAGVIVLTGAGYVLYKKKSNILGPVFKKKYQKLLKK